MGDALGIEHLFDLSGSEKVWAFFTFRQRFDDKECAQKYGPEKWAEYQEKVPYRIFPGVY